MMDINSNQKELFDQARNSLDLTGLNNIRQQSRSEDGEAKQAALKEAAQQFEAIFMRMLLSSMRKAQDVLESDSPFNSQSTKFYRDMHDQQMAVELSNNGSLGLTDLIVRQLGGDNGSFKPSSALRNDGNLPNLSNKADNEKNNETNVENKLSSITDKSNRLSQSDDKTFNALVEKMLSAPNQSSAVDVPLIANDQYRNRLEALLESSNAINDDITASNTIADVKNSSSFADQDFNEPKDFVTALIEPAKKVEQKLGIPFEVVIAQAALETGWGQKIIKQSDGSSSNNLFNIKADSRWAGDKVTKETLEFEQGAMVKKAEPFRTYETLGESINDYINFLSTNDRYGEALQNPSNVEHFLQGLQKAGYATDPRYADKILGTLKSVTNLITK